jgi:G3E family GTPase
MTAAQRAPVPTLLVTGFLGVGKTTLLAGWLARRPAGERWAVLVNEFGAVGIDRAQLGGGADVFEVAGGCACCAAEVAFRTTLTRLLRRGPWHRLLIETSGLGHPAQLVDRLREPAFRALIDVLPPVAVIDARRAGLSLDASHPSHPVAAAQVTLARLLVVNRAGAIAPAELERLAAALTALPPWSRPVLRTSDGNLAFDEMLRALRTVSGPASPMDAATAATASSAAAAARNDDAAGPADERTTLPGGGVRWLRGGSGAWACGWWWPADRVFDRRRLEAALHRLSDPASPLRAHGLLRMKGVFRTERAWYAWNWVDGTADWAETQWRADNRFEAIAIRRYDPQIVDRALDRAG